jgi:hypothetical protein
MVGRRFDRLASRGAGVGRFRVKGRNQLDRWGPGHKLGGRHKLFQAGRTQLGRLDEAQDLLLVNDRQTAIHAVMKGNTPAGEVEAFDEGNVKDDIGS